MLSVILIWSYMFLTMFLTGYAFLRLVSARLEYRIRHVDTYVVCGLVLMTVYAQFFSLFYKVGLAANLLLCIVCAVIILRYRKELGTVAAEILCLDKKEKRTVERGRRMVVLFLFFLFAYGASRGWIHYDTGLYHAQSIRWIEEYGVVKGLGNLHCRLAYNSASFALSALYSMAFLGGQSFHCAAGLTAWILAKVCAEIGESIQKRSLRVSDYARVMGVYYLVNIFDEMVSPASDYFMVLLAFYIIIRWLDLLDQKERNLCPYALLCLTGVFLITVKLSAALILLLTCYPAYYMLRDRKWKQSMGWLGLGILIAVPYFIRNILISGWLVYPFTAIDLFNVRWKIPKGLAEYDAKEIKVWGRGYQDVTQYDRSIREWLPEWFQKLQGADKLFVLLALLAVGVLLFYIVGMIFRWWNRDWGLVCVQATMAASLLFWLFTSPLIRYGCVYAYLTPAVVFGGILVHLTEGIGKHRYRWKLLCILGVSLLLVYKTVALAREIYRDHTNQYWVLQKDYENYEVVSYEIEGETFYYPLEGDQVGYESFPSSPAKAEIRFLGQGIAEGFESGIQNRNGKE